MSRVSRVESGAAIGGAGGASSHAGLGSSEERREVHPELVDLVIPVTNLEAPHSKVHDPETSVPSSALPAEVPSPAQIEPLHPQDPTLFQESPQPPPEKKSGRNSQLRELFNWLDVIAVFLHDRKVTANQVTLAGLSLYAALCIATIVLQSNEAIDSWPKALLWILTYTIINLADSLDGRVARLYADNDETFGQLVDGWSDRIQEWMGSAARAIIAFQLGYMVGMQLALLAALTNPLTSWMRARLEEVGETAPETPKGIGLFGSRGGRVFLAGVMGLPEFLFVNIQQWTDLLSSLMNAYVAKQRYDVGTAKKQRKSRKERLAQRAEDYKELVPIIVAALLGNEDARERLHSYDKNKVRLIAYEVSMWITTMGTAGIWLLLK